MNVKYFKNGALMKVLFILPFIFSCQHFNTDSRREYEKQVSFRHGIVPLSIEAEAPVKSRLVLSEESISRGKELYLQKCLDCHGRSGVGDGPAAKYLDKKPADLSMLAKKVPNFKFYMLLSSWKGKMPGWKEALSSDEIEELEAYILYFSQKRK
jgi:cytochrome c553